MFKPLMLLIFGLAGVSAMAQTNIFINSPAANERVPTKFEVNVTVVSSIEINKVTGVIVGTARTFDFTSDGMTRNFSALVDLTGLVQQQYDLTVTVEKLDATTVSKTVTIIYDNPPTLTVNSLPRVIRNSFVRIKANTSEPTTITVYDNANRVIFSSPSPLDYTYDVFDKIGSGFALKLKAVDAVGLSTETVVGAAVDYISHIDSLGVYPEQPIEIDSARILSKVPTDDFLNDDYVVTNFVTQESFRLHKKNVAPDGAYDRPVQLTPWGLVAVQVDNVVHYGSDSVETIVGPGTNPATGAVVNVLGLKKAGQYFAFSTSTSKYYLVHGPSLLVTTLDNYMMHHLLGNALTAEGNVVAGASADFHPSFIFEGTPYSIDGDRTASMPASGHRVLFRRSVGDKTQLVLSDLPSGTEKILVDNSDESTLEGHGGGYRFAGDYVVYRQKGNLGQLNIFRYKVGDAQPERITSYGYPFDLQIRGLMSNGDFVFDDLSNRRRMLYSNGTLKTLGPNHTGQLFQYRDTWYVAPGGVLFKYNLSPTTPPSLTGFSVDVDFESRSAKFTTQQFANAYTNSKAMTNVRIESVPVHGDLMAQGNGGRFALQAGDIVSYLQTGNLSYIADDGFSGDDTFRFNASNGAQYAENAATVTLHVQQVPVILGLEPASSQTLHISPNPFEHTINISAPTNGFRLDLFSLNGNQMLSNSFEGNTATLDLHDLTNGIYVAVVKTGNSVNRVKIVKMR